MDKNIPDTISKLQQMKSNINDNDYEITYRTFSCLKGGAIEAKTQCALWITTMIYVKQQAEFRKGPYYSRWSFH